MDYEGDCLERVAHIALSPALAEDGAKGKDGERLVKENIPFHDIFYV